MHNCLSSSLGEVWLLKTKNNGAEHLRYFQNRLIARHDYEQVIALITSYLHGSLSLDFA